MSKYIDADNLIERLEEMKRAEYENCGGVNSKTGALQEVQELIDSLQQEYPKMNIPSAGSGAMGTIPPKFKLDVKTVQPEVDLEKAARHVYESWMGGTMDDVRRDMVKLGTVLNARKEE